ncbi:MAG TPA: nascent polypeptide-associated complex protein [Candidatus Nanoarchaeia archaeon]|nr:nascent polypeptide-associated complex protein [Candidatus Nanoarchaeia archaeon]
MNKRQAEQMMRQLGMKSEEIEAIEVTIKTPQKEIIISEPNVTKINMMGQDTFQIVGRITERALSSEPDISKEDIQTVMDGTNASKEEALKAIKEANGDLAKAILELKK